MEIKNTICTFRKTSEVAVFPYKPSTVPFILITDNTIIYAQTPDQKKQVLTMKSDKDILLAIWPGSWRSDIFIVDNNLESIIEKLSKTGMPTCAPMLKEQK
jgi:hypothetical protein